jgi:hypothetical protein
MLAAVSGHLQCFVDARESDHGAVSYREACIFASVEAS